MIVIDAGNSRMVFARFEGERIVATAGLDVGPVLERQALFALLEDFDIFEDDGIVVSSVNLRVNALLRRELANRRHLFISPETEFGITNCYGDKDSLGLDRLVNASAACHFYGAGSRPVVVADLGTATTIDYITGQGDFLGGVIAPGIRSSYEGLLLRAPHLPEVALDPPLKLIGRQTADCLKSGLISGHAAMIRGLSSRMGKEMGTEPLLLVTGGFCPLMEGELGMSAVIDPDLTLKGLMHIGSLAGINLATLS